MCYFVIQLQETKCDITFLQQLIYSNSLISTFDL